MDNLNKFLQAGEVVVFQTKARPRRYKTYGLYVLIFFSFFLLYPMLSLGRTGFFIWLVFIFLLFLALARQIISGADQYLLTNQRIIYLQAISRDYFKAAWSFYLTDIQDFTRRGVHRINVRTAGGSYPLYLQGSERFAQNLKRILDIILVKV